MLAYTKQIFGMNNPVQLLPRNIPRMVAVIKTLQQPYGEMETFQTGIILPWVNGTLLDSHTEKRLCISSSDILRQTIAIPVSLSLQNGHYLTRNREISAFHILLHESFSGITTGFLSRTTCSRRVGKIFSPFI